MLKHSAIEPRMTQECWGKIVTKAEQLKDRIYVVYDAFGEDKSLKSDLDDLWQEYRRLMGLLELACPGYIHDLQRRVIAERDKLESRLDILLREDDPDFEQELTRYDLLSAEATALAGVIRSEHR